MGASGSGKTRLLRAIADLDPAAGECSLQDVARSRIPVTEWRRRLCAGGARLVGGNDNLLFL